MLSLNGAMFVEASALNYEQRFKIEKCILQSCLLSTVPLVKGKQTHLDAMRARLQAANPQRVSADLPRVCSKDLRISSSGIDSLRVRLNA